MFCVIILATHAFGCIFFAVSVQSTVTDAACQTALASATTAAVVVASPPPDVTAAFVPVGWDNGSTGAASIIAATSALATTTNTAGATAIPTAASSSSADDDDAAAPSPLHWVEVDGLVEMACTVDGSTNTTEPWLHSTRATAYQYVRSVYWVVVSMTGLGCGDVVARNANEMLASCAVIYMGVLLLLCVVANVSTFIADLERDKSAHDQQLDVISTYISKRQAVPDAVKHNVRLYYQYKWDSMQGFEPQRELTSLPPNLQAQLVGQRSQRLLHKMEFLRQCPNRAFVAAVLQTLAEEIMLPNDVVLRHGSQLRDAVCLCQGECELLDVRNVRGDDASGNGGGGGGGGGGKEALPTEVSPTVLMTYDGKDMPVLGATSVICPITQNGEVRARTFCELLVLPGAKFQKLQAEFLSPAQTHKMVAAAGKSTRRAKKMDKLFGLSGDSNKSTKKGGKCKRLRELWKKGAAPASTLRQTAHALLALAVAWYLVVIPLVGAFSFSDCASLQQGQGGSSGISSNSNSSSNGTTTTTYASSSATTPSAALVTVYALDSLWDACHVLDTVLRWRYYSFSHNGVSVYLSSLIAKNYCRSGARVALDVVAGLPLHLLAVWVGVQWYFLLRVNKFLYCSRFGAHAQAVLSVLTLRFNCIVTSTVRRLASLTVLVLLWTHMMGCGWIFMAYYAVCSDTGTGGFDDGFVANASNIATTTAGFVFADSSSSSNSSTTSSAAADAAAAAAPPAATPANWIERDAAVFRFDQTPAFIYLRACYWVLCSTTSTGYGDLPPNNAYELTFVTLVVLCGGLLYPATVGVVGVLFATLGSTSRAFRAKLAMVNTYMDHRHFPAQLETQVNSYFDYMWYTHGGVEEDCILRDLPPSLRRQIYCTIHRPALRAMSMFHGCSAEFCNEIMALMRSSVYLPSDLLIQVDEKAEHMYFLHQGVVRVLNRDETVVLAVLGAGDSFGEAALLQDLHEVPRSNSTKGGGESVGGRGGSGRSTGNSGHSVGSAAAAAAAATRDAGGGSGAAARAAAVSSLRTANVRALTYCNCITLGNTEFTAVLDDWLADREVILHNIDRQFAAKQKQNSCVQDNFRRYRKLHSLVSLSTHLCSAENSLAGLNSVPSQSFRHHDSTWQRLWRSVQFVGTLYCLVVTPARVAFATLVPVWCFAIDAAFDCLSVADMCIKDRLVAFMERGQMHTQPHEVGVSKSDDDDCRKGNSSSSRSGGCLAFSRALLRPPYCPVLSRLVLRAFVAAAVPFLFLATDSRTLHQVVAVPLRLSGLSAYRRRGWHHHAGPSIQVGC
jgi:CRP-like cAMP-binding protein